MSIRKNCLSVGEELENEKDGIELHEQFMWMAKTILTRQGGTFFRALWNRTIMKLYTTLIDVDTTSL